MLNAHNRKLLSGFSGLRSALASGTPRASLASALAAAWLILRLSVSDVFRDVSGHTNVDCWVYTFTSLIFSSLEKILSIGVAKLAS